MREYRGERVDGRGFVYGNVNFLEDGVFILEQDQYGNIEYPEFHSSGMGCGLEDRNIHDRYEAMYHGWEKALDRQSELLPNFAEVKKETVVQYIGAEDKNGNRLFEKDKVIYKGKKGVFTIQYFPKYCAYGLAEEGCDKPIGRSGSSTKYEPYFLTKYHLNKIEKV